jgi:hypothetical protein
VRHGATDARGRPVSDTESPAAAKPAVKRRRGGVSLIVLAVATGGLLIAGVTVYVARREIAREAVIGWLEKKGIDADITFDRLDSDGFTGKLRAGPAGKPDLVVERIEVDMKLGAPWSKGGFSVTPTKVRLLHPVVRAKWKDDAVTFGTLDPLVREILAKPTPPDQTLPRITVEKGRVELASPYGPLLINADALVDNGRLITLDARAPRTRLKGQGLDADLGFASVKVSTQGQRARLDVNAALDTLTTPDLKTTKAVARLGGDLPYPDFKSKKSAGPVVLSGAFSGADLGVSGTTLTTPSLDFTFSGQAAGWLDALRLTGEGVFSGRAAELASGQNRARAVVLRGDVAHAEFRYGPDGKDKNDEPAIGLFWRLQGSGGLTAAQGSGAGADVQGVRLDFSSADVGGRSNKGVEGVFRTTARIDRLTQGALKLAGLTGDLRGDLRMSDGVLFDLKGALNAAHGSYPALGPITADDDAGGRALKAALNDFRLELPAFTLETGSPGTTVELGAPARLLAASGGEAVLTPRRGQPLYSDGDGPGRGAFDIVLRGGALPQAQVAVNQFVVQGGEVRAQTVTKASFDFGPVRQGVIETAGTVALHGAVLTYSPTRCTSFTAEQLELELGENDVTKLTTSICAVGGPLLTVANGLWRAAGRLETTSAAIPSQQLLVSDAAGAFQVQGNKRGLNLQAQLANARLADGGKDLRFKPVTLAGTADLSGDRYKGAFDVAAKGGRLARLVLAGDTRTGAGGADIDARGLAFKSGGLQPADLSPALNGLVQSPVQGVVDFTGRIDWTKDGLTSSGRFATAGLDFKSAAGKVTGLKTDVVLTSLLPLASEPGQVLHIAKLDAAAPVTDTTATFQLTPDALKLDAGSFAALEGRVDIDPLVIPFTGDGTITSVAILKGLQLSGLVENTSLGDRIDFDAKVDGRLPFSFGPGGLRIVKGELHAIQPGRLSIDPSLLTGVQAAGGAATPDTPAGTPAAPNAATSGGIGNFAYQALEHLSFQTLTAQVDSQPGGRLGVLFGIRGRHDPPKRQEIKLTWIDILRRKFVPDDVQLPSDTEINLTLDTSWNLDDLLKSLQAMQGDRSQPVQPTKP